MLVAVTKSEGGIDLGETTGASAPVEDMLASDNPAQDMLDSVAPSEDVVISEAPTGEQSVAATGSEDYLLLKLTLMARLVPRLNLRPCSPLRLLLGRRLGPCCPWMTEG